MKKLLIFIVLLAGINVSYVRASEYKLDDAKIEAMFDNAEQIDFSAFTDNSLEGLVMAGTGNNALLMAGKSPVVAFVLCTFLGGLGIHRVYLGTKGLTVVGYIITCGGFGIVTFVDWVFLIIGMIDNDVSKYENNPKFFMW